MIQNETRNQVNGAANTSLTEADLNPNESKQVSFFAACFLPYGFLIWASLSYLVGTTFDTPPLLELFKNLASLVLVFGVGHCALGLVIRKSPQRELVLLAMIVFVMMYGTFSGKVVHLLGNSATLMVWSLICLGSMVSLYRFGSHPAMKEMIWAPGFGLVVVLVFQCFWIGKPMLNDLTQLGKLNWQPVQKSSNDVGLYVGSSVDSKRPDIYYIVVDAYCREDVLNELYGFDNAGFLGSLEQRDFFIGTESRSNYPCTEFSLASTLNLMHLTDLGLETFETNAPLHKMLMDCYVNRYLKQLGYQSICFDSGKLQTSLHSFTRFESPSPTLNGFQDTLIHQTVVPELMKYCAFGFRSVARQHGDRIIDTLNEVGRVVTASDPPTFVFAHLLSPHPPFVFDSDGNEVEKYGYFLRADADHFTERFECSPEIYKDAYVQQLRFLNKRLLATVDAIQERDRDAIIIIQGDHGPRLNVGRLNFEPKPQMDEIHREGYAILNAIHVPAPWRPEFYDSQSSVNTFGLIFNEVFGAQFELLEDRSYLPSDKYLFSDVTDQSLPNVVY
ncbi:MAG: sulfatase-like hydrolase/transferase [Planctomycetota bacterium]